MLIFSHFFLSPKHFLLIYFTLKFPDNGFSILIPESFPSTFNLTPSSFLLLHDFFLIKSQLGGHLPSMQHWLSVISDKFPKPYSLAVAKFCIRVACCPFHLTHHSDYLSIILAPLESLTTTANFEYFFQSPDIMTIFYAC